MYRQDWCMSVSCISLKVRKCSLNQIDDIMGPVAKQTKPSHARDHERVRHRLWSTCNNRTMVPHKEIQWNNGTPQEKFYSLATFGHKREDNQVPHKCHV